MGNLADDIERFILRKLAGEKGDIIILRRNELADELACAPSQISYVLSTRFSVDRGFVVESRRGLGGFIRIARIPVQNLVYEDTDELVDVGVTLDELAERLVQYKNKGLLTNREALLLMETFAYLYRFARPMDRVDAIKELLAKLRKMDE